MVSWALLVITSTQTHKHTSTQTHINIFVATTCSKLLQKENKKPKHKKCLLFAFMLHTMSITQEHRGAVRLIRCFTHNNHWELLPLVNKSCIGDVLVTLGTNLSLRGRPCPPGDKHVPKGFPTKKSVSPGDEFVPRGTSLSLGCQGRPLIPEDEYCSRDEYRPRDAHPWGHNFIYLLFWSFMCI